MSTAVDVEELSKSFRTRQPRGAGFRARVADVFAPRSVAVCAVDRISFRIEAGERVAFIGPNGAGKSTTLKVLAGILYPTDGHVTVAGLVPWRERQALGFAIGTVFGQRSQLWYQLAPRETLQLLARVYELPRDIWRARLGALVHAFELEALLDRPVRQLSLGERMRCEIAASLLHAPRVLFLDEPTIRGATRRAPSRVVEECWKRASSLRWASGDRESGAGCHAPRRAPAGCVAIPVPFQARTNGTRGIERRLQRGVALGPR